MKVEAAGCLVANNVEFQLLRFYYVVATESTWAAIHGRENERVLVTYREQHEAQKLPQETHK